MFPKNIHHQPQSTEIFAFNNFKHAVLPKTNVCALLSAWMAVFLVTRSGLAVAKEFLIPPTRYSEALRRYSPLPPNTGNAMYVPRELVRHLKAYALHLHADYK